MSVPESLLTTEKLWCSVNDGATLGIHVGMALTESGSTKRHMVSSIRDGYVYTVEWPHESAMDHLRDLTRLSEELPGGYR